MRWGEDGGPRLLSFQSETAAISHVADFLRPHCASLVIEPVFANGLRPDIGFRLKVAPDVALVVECKKFGDNEISALGSAIRQAYSYTNVTNRIALIAPIEARGPSHLTWQTSAIGAIGILASQFSVGYLYEHPGGGGGIYIGGQAAVRFSGDQATLHPKADILLTRKQFCGSTTWRKAS